MNILLTLLPVALVVAQHVFVALGDEGRRDPLND